ncbi:MAG: hypothetical protein AAGE92_09665 [Cyanobacteria bacterium P01_G01_bin.4]
MKVWFFILTGGLGFAMAAPFAEIALSAPLSASTAIVLLLAAGSLCSLRFGIALKWPSQLHRWP